MSSNRFALSLHSDLAPIDLPEMAAELPGGKFLYLSETELDGETWFRLRLGFFSSEGSAEAAMENWLSDYPSAWIVAVGPQERADAGRKLLHVEVL